MIFESLHEKDLPFIKLDPLKQQFDSGRAGTNEIKLLYKLYVLTLWKKAFTV
jgi:hypothetical protein